MAFEQCVIQGNLGKQATVRGGSISFSVAVGQPKKDGVEAPPMWYSVTAGMDRFEGILPYLTKGKPVFVSGKVRSYSYSADGRDKTGLVIHAYEVIVLGGNPSRQTEGDDYDEPPDDIPF